MQHRGARPAKKKQALVRRELLSRNKYISGTEAGTEIFKGSGRLDTKTYSVDIG
ncbi:hypothetical protein ABZ642_19575 [Streptomyces sp. NPDC007157]|uniref:hypothetical protein n=1 Tax=Streptomyces sp. NPDC007157 TaxID=3154681 RepID=UPI0033C836A2